VVKLIKEQVDSGEYTEKHEAALIYRTNAQSRALEEACVQRNLPYVVFGSATSFYKRQEIKDSLCFLRWLYNGMDRGSMLRAFKTPAKGLGDKALQEFDSFCQSVEEFVAYNHPECTRPTPLDMLLLLSEGDKPAWAPNAPSPGDSISTRALKSLVVFSQQMRALRTMAYQEPVDVLVGHVVESFNLLPHLDKVSKSKGEFEERKANIQELLKATQRYAKAGPSLLRESDPIRGGEFEDGVAEPPLGTFLDDVALVTDMADQSLDANEHKFKVCLMTIHASKGMEFDTVFVVGNEDGTFPSSQAIMEGDGSVVLEEEKRLCYVAMTRAKTELVMTWRKEVPVFTSVGMRYVKKDRSRFLNVLVDGKKGKTSSGKEGLKASSPASTRQKAARSIKGTNSVFSRGPSSLAASARRRSSSTASGAPSWQTKSYTDSPVRSARYEPRSTSNYQSNGANSKRPKPFGTTNIFSRQRSELARQQPSTPPYPKPPPPKQQIRPPDGKEIKSSSQVPNQNMDSTWFFPVGSKVKHVKFGEGIVLNPPSARSEGDMPVLVKFPDGERREFSAHGRDLSPVFV
jgi:ATP-dependent exoDNAse (exonuclease V) beta subunit